MDNEFKSRNNFFEDRSDAENSDIRNLGSLS